MAAGKGALRMVRHGRAARFAPGIRRLRWLYAGRRERVDQRVWGGMDTNVSGASSDTASAEASVGAAGRARGPWRWW